MMSMLCNCCVRELLILARTWFAFGLPSKTRCDSFLERGVEARRRAAAAEAEAASSMACREGCLEESAVWGRGLSPTTATSGGSKNSYWGYLIEEDKGQWQALFSHLSHLFHTSRGDYKSQVILQLISMT
jgi:hypothetical protein